MKNRGFTLVELLAVLVLISAIALISVPSILNYINGKKNEISEVTKKLIYSGAELYVDANEKDFDKILGNQKCITLQDIIDEKYLSAPILDSVSGKEINPNKFVKVLYTYDIPSGLNKFSYEISDSCTDMIKICTLTEGNPYEVGSKYICDTGDGEIRTFYVLENIEDSPNVSLIMDRNIDNKTVGWCLSGSENTCGASGAIAALEEKTSGWNNYQIISIDLPTYDQLYNVNQGDNLTKTPWLYNFLDSDSSTKEPLGYWASTPHLGTKVYAWSAYYTGRVVMNLIGHTHVCGIRPVILVAKSNI